MKTAGELARDAAIGRVVVNNLEWAQRVNDYFNNTWLPSKPKGFEFIGEDFRYDVLASGIEPPKHPNAWGGIFSHIAKSKSVEATGATRKMLDENSHARRSFVYRKK